MSVNNPGSSAFLPLTSTGAGVGVGGTLISAGTNTGGLIISGVIAGADTGPIWDTAVAPTAFGPIYVPAGVSISTGGYNGLWMIQAGSTPLALAVPGDIGSSYGGYSIRYRLL